MSNYPSVKAKDFIKVIEQLGFYFDRQKGSHAIYPTFSRLFRTKNNICGRKHQEIAKLASVY